MLSWRCIKIRNMPTGIDSRYSIHPLHSPTLKLISYRCTSRRIGLQTIGDSAVARGTKPLTHDVSETLRKLLSVICKV